MKSSYMIASFAALFIAGCASTRHAHNSHRHQAKARMGPHSAKKAAVAVAVVKPTSGNRVNGTVSFIEKGGKVFVVAKIYGLTPGNHGFHIHQYGDCSHPKGKSAGGHFNPDGHNHSSRNDSKRHAGDLGNLTADQNGVATIEFEDHLLTLKGAKSILGRAVIVHAKADDLKSQPTGGAGARVACGVIGVSGT